MHAVLIFKVVILKVASIKCSKTVQCLACSARGGALLGALIMKPADCFSECSYQLRLQLHHVIIRGGTKSTGTHLCWDGNSLVAS